MIFKAKDIIEFNGRFFFFLLFLLPCLWSFHEEKGFPGGSESKESACNAEDLGSVPGLGRCPGGGHGNPLQYSSGFPGGSYDKESACNAGDLGSIPKLGRSPEIGNGNPLQYSRLENPMDRGAWWVRKYSENIPALP